MGKFAMVVLLLVVGGAAASYPAWSQLAGQISSSAMLQPSTTSPASSSNSTDQAVSQNTTEPDVISPQAITATESASGVPFGSDWMSQFVNVVDGYRGGESLTECARLDSFAMTRFETMTNGSNWEITHYGYAQDEGRAFGGVPALYAEDYFYPNEPYPRTPEGFATLVMTTAPGHWSDLTSSGFKYYGAYYTGQGPLLLYNRTADHWSWGRG